MFEECNSFFRTQNQGSILLIFMMSISVVNIANNNLMQYSLLQRNTGTAKQSTSYQIKIFMKLEANLKLNMKPKSRGTTKFNT